MDEKYLVALLTAHWPTITIAIGIAATYVRLSAFTAQIQQMQRRVSKLIKLHADKHKEDAAYLYDDTRE